MEIFKQLLKHYLTLALTRGPMKIDGDMWGEMADMTEALDAYIKAQIKKGIDAHEQANHEVAR